MFETTKVSLLRRYKGNAIFRFLIRKIIAPCHFMTFFKTLEAKVVADYLEASPGERILDVGCGSGERSVNLAARGCTSYGIDVDSDSIEMARLLFGDSGNFLRTNGEWLPFRSEVFDKVACVCALEHIDNDEKALKEAWRVLKPGGILVVTVDSLSNQGLKEQLREKHRHKNHVVRYYSLSQLEAKLANNGWEVEEGKYFINSPLGAFFFNLWIEKVWLCSLLYLLAVGLSYISDRLSGRSDQGYLLGIKARKLDSKPDSISEEWQR